jgi:nitrogen fixation NifU-like protein
MSSSELESLYREVVLDHHRHPRGNHDVDGCDVAASGQNPACGDEVALQLRFDGDRIDEVGVISHGCAISTSSGSMLAEMIGGLTTGEAEHVAELFRKALQGEKIPSEVDMGDLEALTGVRKFPVRIKCALLPWVTLLDAILAYRQGRAPRPVTTEDSEQSPADMAVWLEENAPPESSQQESSRHESPKEPEHDPDA